MKFEVVEISTIKFNKNTSAYCFMKILFCKRKDHVQV